MSRLLAFTAILLGTMMGGILTSPAGLTPDEHTVQRFGPTTNSQGATEAERNRRTSLIAVGPPACSIGQYYTARQQSTDFLGLWGVCFDYPADYQLRMLDSTFPGVYFARNGRPACVNTDYLQPHKQTPCIPFDPVTGPDLFPGY